MAEWTLASQPSGGTVYLALSALLLQSVAPFDAKFLDPAARAAEAYPPVRVQGLPLPESRMRSGAVTEFGS